MHGRLKKAELAVGAEQRAEQRERVKKGVFLFQHLLDQKQRKCFTPENFASTGKLLEVSPEIAVLWAFRRDMLTHFIHLLKSRTPSTLLTSTAFSSSPYSSSASSPGPSSQAASSSPHSSSSASSPGPSPQSASSSPHSSSSASSPGPSSQAASSSPHSSSSASSPGPSSQAASSASSLSSARVSDERREQVCSENSDPLPRAASSFPSADGEEKLSLFGRDFACGDDQAERRLLREELSVTLHAIGKKSAKSYCVWSHRTWTLGQLLASLLDAKDVSLLSSSPAPSSSSSSPSSLQDGRERQEDERQVTQLDSAREKGREEERRKEEREEEDRDFQEALTLLDEEIQHCNALLLRRGEDGRNFHCWQHRSQVIAWRVAVHAMRGRREEERRERGDAEERGEKEGSHSAQERAEDSAEEGSEEQTVADTLELTKTLIEKDFSNYSAWGQRAQGLATGLLNWDAELDWIWQGLYTEPGDQTLWKVYLSLLERTVSRLPSPSVIAFFPLPPAARGDLDAAGLAFCVCFSVPASVDASQSRCFLHCRGEKDCPNFKGAGKLIRGKWKPLSPLATASTEGLNPTIGTGNRASSTSPVWLFISPDPSAAAVLAAEAEERHGEGGTEAPTKKQRTNERRDSLTFEFLLTFSRFAGAFQAEEQRARDHHLLRLPKHVVAQMQLRNSAPRDSTSDISSARSSRNKVLTDILEYPCRRIRFLVSPSSSSASPSSSACSASCSSSASLAASACSRGSSSWRVISQRVVAPRPPAREAESCGEEEASEEAIRQARVEKELAKIDELLALEPSCKQAIETK
uniref:Geranylgeranyl transferase type-2 subunit alpha n=1 Tax=Toxoplasma gondii TgCATBr9 TaxID=943120 RepID=A0A2T6IMF6_TOXGO|nr:hypothetical protein TGBR9_214170A [Toxoplasma gondii TgCATBr9]